MNLYVKKLNPEATLPTYGSAGAAAFDLKATDDALILPQHSKVIPTGLAFEVPAGYVMLVFSRSGHGFNSGVRLANCVGVIDSDYRGEVMVKLTNDGMTPFPVSVGHKIAQAMLVPVVQWDLLEALELTDTARGTGGLGSTGA